MAPTAVLVPLPGVAGAIDGWRRQHTADGREGMPAHVTLLYPFLEAASLADGDLAAVEDALRPFAAFDVAFPRLARFAGEPAVLYLVPRPAAPFVAMTQALVAAFPDHPPYAGAHRTIVAHATVAVSGDAGVLDSIEAALAPRLPIRCRVDVALLMEHGGAVGWRPRARFRLAAPTGTLPSWTAAT